VLLIGHLDTVFEADSPFQRWDALSDSTARGPGVIDMKGGIVVLLLALGALQDAGALDELSFSLALTGDEEKCGEPVALARRDLLALAERAEVALGFEDGAGDPRTAVIARRGATTWELRTTGRAAHSSQIFRGRPAPARSSRRRASWTPSTRSWPARSTSRSTPGSSWGARRWTSTPMRSAERPPES
jgi:glutamate carboxypeptidase